jgi:hypothetical protein
VLLSSAGCRLKWQPNCGKRVFWTWDQDQVSILELYWYNTLASVSVLRPEEIQGSSAAIHSRSFCPSFDI